jgi:hypothetical protein
MRLNRATSRGYSIDDKFWLMVERRGDDDCWHWLGGVGPKGYGKASLYRLVIGAHVLSWIVNTGDITNGFLVCHSCDNPTCVNPKHLFLGTHDDNMKDMDSKGRRRICEQHPFAKLDWDKVRDIRASGESSRSIANRLGVSHKAILAVRNNQTWVEL